MKQWQSNFGTLKKRFLRKAGAIACSVRLGWEVRSLLQYGLVEKCDRFTVQVKLEVRSLYGTG
ncbi:hypothetical protein H6G33_35185 [Calothrix sp. FACHB-1219]|uniref:hypothetical protein n=1 Tax=unclassified Calothrix TaxID=2619626 RepID=UPI00168897EF|nr:MULTISPECIES: hypothetical protein [unclassified Calothrix]MBD2207579.1 hypothetical protein [Calothrix sp. FACHB-168]MBD2222180.1 hypothetical protein [Calothrix sp. FACHB-1219]